MTQKSKTSQKQQTKVVQTVTPEGQGRGQLTEQSVASLGYTGVGLWTKTKRKNQNNKKNCCTKGVVGQRGTCDHQSPLTSSHHSPDIRDTNPRRLGLLPPQEDLKQGTSNILATWEKSKSARSRSPPNQNAGLPTPRPVRARPRGHVPAEPRHRDPLWTLAQAPSPRAPPTTPPYLPLRSPRPVSRVSEPVSAAGSARWVHAEPPPSPPWSGDLRRSGLPLALPEPSASRRPTARGLDRR